MYVVRGWGDYYSSSVMVMLVVLPLLLLQLLIMEMRTSMKMQVAMILS